ncbi:YitT family protein [Paenibacillus athensensis]|uniref:Integral membrane protein n=1 Tax=Paenibacillus athensensis TaxID=1967502 RepID=A0A4Y8PR15_9BACL|nr:YitT family protein [Paenibacillus athensensis]MCD1260505.1 YitT family protein [Paenibacillus athensensis]
MADKRLLAVSRSAAAAWGRRAALMIGGAFIIAAGSVLMIKVSHWGLHPYDVLEYALTDRFGLSFGIWHWIVGLTMVLLSLVLTGRLPRFGVFLEFFLVGGFIDVLLERGIVPDVQQTAAELMYLLAGIALVSLGTALYMSADMGAGPTDWFSLVISEKWGLSFGLLSIATEALAVVGGLLLHGPVQLGTLLFCLVYGPITGFLLKKLAWLRVSGE